jgi:hypothetical protein
MKRTFTELRASHSLSRADDTALGPVYWTDGGVADGRCIRVFEAATDLAPYVALHEYAHLWIHRDYEHDAWFVIDVDEPIEIGADFVIMPRRIGNTLESFVRTDDPADRPARLDELRAVLPKLQAAAADPVDVWIANLVAGRLATPDRNTVFVWADQRFYIQDLAPSRDELRAWQALL